MTAAAIAADLHQPLDVHRDFLPQIAFDAALFLEYPADLAHIVFGKILDADIRAHSGFAQNHVRSMSADAVDIRQADFHPFGSRQIDASNTCHFSAISLAYGAGLRLKPA